MFTAAEASLIRSLQSGVLMMLDRRGFAAPLQRRCEDDRFAGR